MIGLVDEAHFFKKDSIFNGPLVMLVMNAVLIMASTPEITTSACRDIINATYKGRPIIKFVNLEFVCDLCQQAMEEEECEPFVCPHLFSLRPQFHDPEKIFIARAAYGQAGDAFNTEIMGIRSISADAFIPPKDVKATRAREPYKFRRPPEIVIVSCDPSGASRKYIDGNSSDYAITTTVFDDDGTMVVCGADAYRFHGQDAGEHIEKAFVDNYNAIRADPNLRHATIFYVFENNLGREQDHLKRLIKRCSNIFSNCEVLSEKEGKVGFTTSAKTKIASDDTLKLLITMGSLHFYEDFIVNNATLHKERSAKRDIPAAKLMIDILIEQIANMREYTERKATGESRVIITSTHTKKGERVRGRKDDVYRALANTVNAYVKYKQGLLFLDYGRVRMLKRTREFPDEDAAGLLAEAIAERNAKYGREAVNTEWAIPHDDDDGDAAAAK